MISPIVINYKNLNNNLESYELLEDKISKLHALYSILCIYIGLGLLSKPYALEQGGYISFVGMIIICYMVTETAKIFPKCFNKINDTNTYENLAIYCFGKLTANCIVLMIIIEYILANCISIIFIWKNIINFFEKIDIYNIENSCILISSSLLLIIILIFVSIKGQSYINLLGIIVCSILISILMGITIYDFYNNNRKIQENIPNIYNDLYSFSVCIGIYITSFSGHGCLPNIYNSMKNKDDYNSVINISFILMFIFYFITAFTGVLIYGKDINIIVTQNLLHYPDGIISIIMIWLVIIKCFLSQPCYIMILSNIFENKYNIYNKFQIRLLRLVLFIIVCIISYLFHDYLPFIESITGTLFSIPVSIILPALFYIKIYWNDINYIKKLKYSIIFIIGLILCLGLTTFNIMNLIKN